MQEEPRIPSRLPLLEVPDGVLLPGASMRFLAASPANLALVRNRLLSRGSLGRSCCLTVVSRKMDWAINGIIDRAFHT